MAYVIGVAGVAGAGKTSLTRALVEAIDDSAAIHIDDYQRITHQPLGKIALWMQRGADFNEFPIPLLPEHLAKLKRGESVIDPLSMRQIAARKYIVFETHFGRAHQASGGLIDFLVWLDTPPDVALARNLRDLIGPLLRDPRTEPGRGQLAWIDSYLGSYLAEVRRMALVQKERVAAGADLIVDGSQELGSIVATTRTAILARLP
jgi:uridine kinase